MTVCIAALYDGGKGFVLASDQMLTLHYPMAYEFENEEFDKIFRLCDEVPIYCLSAGNAIFAQEIMDSAKTQIMKDRVSSADKAALIVREYYAQYRMRRLIRNELETRGLDLNSFYKNHKALLPEIVSVIDRSFKTFNLGVEFIVVGYGGATCHIYTIIHPGEVYCYDSIGYASIGIGAPHVVYHMIENKYRRSLSMDSVSKLVDNAKERSQVAPGVGELTRKIIEPRGDENNEQPTNN